MKLYILSDIHYDFYLKSYHGNMDRFFEQRFLPADTIVMAGDIANTFADTELFLKEISKRYKNVVLCLGNHDLTLTWENGAFKTSEEKMKALLAEKPDVMLTHFSPLRNNMPVQYKANEYSTYFYFDNKIAEDYLAESSGRIWCSGHVHDAYKDGQILIHPNAYPNEHARVFNNLHRKDFLVEV